MTSNGEVNQKASLTWKLQELAKAKGLSLYSVEFAKALDAEDKLSHFRNRFLIPTMADVAHVTGGQPSSEEVVYFGGHSLGLQPCRLAQELDASMQQWGRLGVLGHCHAEPPWARCDEPAQRVVSELIGAISSEVAIMNALTVNLHIMLTAFYRPTQKRYKILFEKHAFPSDHYAFESQVRLHGYDPQDALLLMEPRSGEHCLRTEDIVSFLREHGSEIQLVCFPGVQYYTGQLFDINTITQVAHECGCRVGWDLAHAVGNVELSLHDWDVDFAVWCHYKYLCAGAGATGGAFLHQRHAKADFMRMEGWWGHHPASRFQMDCRMDPTIGIAGYKISNPSLLATLPVKVGAEIYLEAGMDRLRSKSLLLTAFFQLLMDALLQNEAGEPLVEIITPRNPEERGAQLSFIIRGGSQLIFDKLGATGIICDFRKPSVIRATPTPIYNSFHDVFTFVNRLKQVLNSCGLVQS